MVFGYIALAKGVWEIEEVMEVAHNWLKLYKTMYTACKIMIISRIILI